MTTTPAKTGGATGHIVQVIGPVVDLEFPPEQLPDLMNAVHVALPDGGFYAIGTMARPDAFGGTTYSTVGIARLKANGALDPSFARIASRSVATSLPRRTP